MNNLIWLIGLHFYVNHLLVWPEIVTVVVFQFFVRILWQGDASMSRVDECRLIGSFRITFASHVCQ